MSRRPIARSKETETMKIVKASFQTALALCLAVTAADAQDSRVSVVFATPAQYRDLKTACVSGDADARALMGEIERFLRDAAGRRLTEGQRLEITVTNIDMAGEIESLRGPGRCDLRAATHVFPPPGQLPFPPPRAH